MPLSTVEVKLSRTLVLDVNCASVHCDIETYMASFKSLWSVVL